MAFDFDALKPEAKKAAFAHMDRKRGGRGKRGGLGSGAVHKRLKGKTGQTSAQYRDTGKPTSGDVDRLVANYRAMHGRDPSPKQLAKLRKKKR